MSQLSQKLGCRIRVMRVALNYTQENMADLLKMSVSGYAKIERGETDIPLSKLQKIAEVFNITLVELVDIDKIHFPQTQPYKKEEMEWIVQKIELLEKEIVRMRQGK